MKRPKTGSRIRPAGTLALLTAGSLLFAGHAGATFHGRLPATPGGTDYQAYYDDQLNITWTADSTLGGLATMTNHMQAAANLDINGVTGWRLPIVASGVDCTVPSVAQSECMVNEYGHLYWYGAGTVHGAGVTFENQGPFSNISENPGYWSGSEAQPFVIYTFSFSDGVNGADFIDCCVAYSWYVRDGDVGGSGTDSDGDGVADANDNCTLIANPSQLDSNGDLFGNACDPDLNNDGIVNPIDLGIFRSVFFSANADADFNGDGVVNPIDLGILRAFFFGPPGPSGLVP